MNRKFDFDDILITPAILSDINSRSEVNPYCENGLLPLMTAPMDTVISNDNKGIFLINNILPVLPRNTYTGLPPYPDGHFYSYGIDEFEKLFINNEVSDDYGKLNVLIDVANGHMKRLYDLSKQAIDKYGDRMNLMIGNVANPDTFKLYCDIGVTYVRLSIGTGNSCTTSANVAVGFPLGSLISECHKIKKDNEYSTKIVADGGFKNYSDIIKGLGLGAETVMLGSIFNKALESCGNTTDINDKVVNQYDVETLKRFKSGQDFFKKFRGMSTKEVQRDWGKEIVKTSEGISKTQKVEYTLSGWVENFTDYLKSAMSYTNSRTLSDFIGNVDFTFITENSLKRFSK